MSVVWFVELYIGSNPTSGHTSRIYRPTIRLKYHERYIIPTYTKIHIQQTETASATRTPEHITTTILSITTYKQPNSISLATLTHVPTNTLKYPYTQLITSMCSLSCAHKDRCTHTHTVSKYNNELNDNYTYSPLLSYQHSVTLGNRVRETHGAQEVLHAIISLTRILLYQ